MLLVRIVNVNLQRGLQHFVGAGIVFRVINNSSDTVFTSLRILGLFLELDLVFFHSHVTGCSNEIVLNSVSLFRAACISKCKLENVSFNAFF